VTVPSWSTACPDWERRIVARQPLITFPPLFPTEAQLALDVFNELRVKDVQGAPPMRDLCQPWLTDFVSAIFGAYDADAGRRLIQEFFLLISKKNSKSTGAAGIMLTALIRNWREAAEFYVLAPTIEVAHNSFNPARDMVRKDPELSALMHVQEHYRTITHRETGASFKVVAADSETVSGKKGTGILVEELWQFGKNARAENMLIEATGGLASRPEGFVIFISTQSDEPPTGVFAQKLKYARDVRDGKIVDPKFLPVLYEFPAWMIESKRHLDPDFFYVTNPNLGYSVDPEYIEREISKAKIAGKGSIRKILAKHLNVQIGMSMMGEPWAGAEFWEACAIAEPVTLDMLIERCDVATFGGDGGGLDDLLGASALGRDRDTGKLLAWFRAWAHPIVLERRTEIASKLLELAAAGEISLVENVGEDVDELADAVEQLHAAGLFEREDDQDESVIPAIGVDPAGIGGMVEAIVARGVPQKKIIGISQGWRMGGAIKTAERWLAGGRVRHGGTALMNWCVSNAKTEQRANSIVITKQASGSAKIDPLMAFFNAVSLMSLVPESGGRSFWDPAPVEEAPAP
jgi:phage terminase large subunit-like protein